MQADKNSLDSKKQTGRWSRQEHQRFMLGLMQYGKNWKKVQEIVGTRSGSQVRSHAQKFFNKLQKGGNQSKSKKQRKPDNGLSDPNDDQVSFNENTDQIRSFQEDYSLATPVEIISLIKKQSIDNRKVNLSNFKKSLEENQAKHMNAKSQDLKNKESFLQLTNKNILPGQPQHEMPFTLNSFKSMNNILSAYEALNETDPVNHEEDESFLIGLTQIYNQCKEKVQKNLIDFGNPHEVAKAAEIEKSMRKKSWTLAQGFDGNEHDLEVIKQKLKDNKEVKDEPVGDKSEKKSQSKKQVDDKSQGHNMKDGQKQEEVAQKIQQKS